MMMWRKLHMPSLPCFVRFEVLAVILAMISAFVPRHRSIQVELATTVKFESGKFGVNYKDAIQKELTIQ